MSLYKPFFRVKPCENGIYEITHNCDGALDFAAHDEVNEKAYRFINMALAEGERRKAAELCKALGITP